MNQENRESASIRSRFIILDPSGQELELSGGPENMAEVDDAALRYIIEDEFGIPGGIEIPSIKAMQKLELVDYETASDSGHFRFYPKGFLVYELIRKWADCIAENLNCYRIKTPLLYDWGHPAINEQAASFHERHYSVYGAGHKDKKNATKEMVLRFAGDFGLFRMLSDAQLTYRHLPLRIYEFSDSFRYEQHGALSGLRRLRAFSMPDIHSFCTDIDQGLDEYCSLFYRYADLIKDSKIEYGITFRIVYEFYEKHKDCICKMLEYCGKSAMVEILPSMKHYWAMKHEFSSIDAVGGICQLSTVQLDVEDAERYGINYRSADNGMKGCIICHSSIGSIERWMFSLLEDALKKKFPALPLWLSPVQVRLVSVSDKYIDKAELFHDMITKMGVRVDIDDSDNSVGKKVREAEKNWIPFTIVVGEKESIIEPFNVRARGGIQYKMNKEQFFRFILPDIIGKPFIKLFYKYTSTYPIFREG